MQAEKLIVPVLCPDFVLTYDPIRSATLLECMAGTTGLEPATSAVTGQRSNQTELRPRNLIKINHLLKWLVALSPDEAAKSGYAMRLCGTYVHSVQARKFIFLHPARFSKPPQ